MDKFSEELNRWNKPYNGWIYLEQKSLKLGKPLLWKTQDGDSSSLWKGCVCSGKLGSCSYTAEIQRIIILTIIHSYHYLEYLAEFSISNLFSGY